MRRRNCNAVLIHHYFKYFVPFYRIVYYVSVTYIFSYVRDIWKRYESLVCAKNLLYNLQRNLFFYGILWLVRITHISLYQIRICIIVKFVLLWLCAYQIVDLCLSIKFKENLTSEKIQHLSSILRRLTLAMYIYFLSLFLSFSLSLYCYNYLDIKFIYI